MIPKKIHYCWFGGNPLPEKERFCMESWRRLCPDYEIVRWDESNYDVSKHPFIKGAYEAGKWAFVSDFARHDIICEHGGIYLDTAVELLKPLDELLEQPAFMAFEQPKYVASGLILAAEPGHEGMRAMFDEIFAQRVFYKKDGSMDLTSIPVLNTAFLKKRGLRPDNSLQTVAGITIYPTEYFCPKSQHTNEMHLTDNTYSIHHFSASWFTARQRKWMDLNVRLRRAGGWRERLAGNRLWKFAGRIYERGWKDAMRHAMKKYGGKE